MGPTNSAAARAADAHCIRALYGADGALLALEELWGAADRTQRFALAPTSHAGHRKCSLGNGASHSVAGTLNAVHGSDSDESAAREIRLFFPEQSEWDGVKR